MERRSLLIRLAAGSVATAAAALPFGLARLMAPDRPADPRTHLPLPGALEDRAAFVDACIGCGLCGEVCPPQCVLFYDREGGDKLNTPYINPEYKACILCGKCMEFCPTDALTITPPREVNMGIAQIDRSACYPWVDKGICGACVAICPLGKSAIGFKMWNQYQPLVREGCVGCGLCVEICPHPSLPIWIVQRGEGMVARHTVG